MRARLRSIDACPIEGVSCTSPRLASQSHHGEGIEISPGPISRPLFKEWGAVRHVECWSDDVPHGKTTDFFMAVKATEGESVVFSWIEYPSKAVRDTANKKMREDSRMKEWGEAMNFIDGKRMVFGGFVPIMDKQG